MIPPFDEGADSALGFFGKVTASISHELRNSLAVINENAGLLADLTFMAEKGAPMDPARLKRVSESLKRQVKRSDQIVGNMNAFAHGPDEPVCTFELDRAVGLTVDLARRMADGKGVSLAHDPGGDTIEIRSSFFLTQYLVWRCLEFCVQGADESRRIHVSCKPAHPGGRVVFTGIDKGCFQSQQMFAEKGPGLLMEKTSAQIRTDPDGGRFTLDLPDLG